MKKMFFLPSKNLVLSIPIVLTAGFFTGLLTDTSFMKSYILALTFLMIYPTMIGFKLKEAVDLSHAKVLLISIGVNFLMIPAVAYGAGRLFLSDNPEMFAGLVLISLFPTSGMTISWTMLNKGNVPAAIKITAVSLLLGSVAAPLYLYLMVGTLVPVNIVQTFITIAQVVVIPMILGNITYRLLLKRITPETFNKKIKPVFPALSVWAMMLIIFISISMKAKAIVGNPEILTQTLLVLVLFYVMNFLASTLIARWTLPMEDGVALLYGTVMRNLSIALGLAITSFGSSTAIVVTLAFILQVQGAAWYGRLAPKYHWLGHGDEKQISSNKAM